MKDTPPERVSELNEWQRESLLCYRKQWFIEADWGQVQPAADPLDRPTVILTSSETGSASEDFLMALETGRSAAVRLGQGTAGSSGQPLMEELPGGGLFSICTGRMPWPDQVAQKGIEPHLWVQPTVECVIRGEDQVLDAAARWLRVGKGQRGD
jgi:C-terminal processing protease CtpA/Prc